MTQAVTPHVRRASDAAGLARSELPLRRRWHAGLPTVEAGDGGDEDEAWLPFGSRYEAAARRLPTDARARGAAAGTPLDTCNL